MNEQFVKGNLVIMIETKKEIQDLTSKIKAIESQIKPIQTSLTIEDVNVKMENLEKNKEIYSNLHAQLEEKSIKRKDAEKMLISEIPIFNQSIDVDLGSPYGLIRMKKTKDLYGEQGPKFEYGHVIK